MVVTNKGHEDDCVSPLLGVIISRLRNIKSDFDVVDNAIWSRIVSQCNKYFWFGATAIEFYSLGFRKVKWVNFLYDRCIEIWYMIRDCSVGVLYAKPGLAPQWLCRPTVFLDVHLSLSGSTTPGLSASLWTSVYFLLHQSSWLQTPLHPPTPSPPEPPLLPSPQLAGRPSPPLSRVSPRHQLWTTYAYPAVHLIQPCHVPGRHGTLLKWSMCLLFVLVCWFTNTHAETERISKLDVGRFAYG